MEAACSCDLENYFDYWLHTGSRIVLEGDWAYDADDSRLQITLTRSGHTENSPDISVQAAVYYADSPVPEIVTMALDDNANTADFDVRSKPVNIMLDPNTLLLAEWTLNERSP